jgi:hypothetical protein
MTFFILNKKIRKRPVRSCGELKSRIHPSVEAISGDVKLTALRYRSAQMITSRTLVGRFQVYAIDAINAHVQVTIHLNVHAGSAGMSLPGLFQWNPYLTRPEPCPHNSKQTDGHSCRIMLSFMRLPRIAVNKN